MTSGKPVCCGAVLGHMGSELCSRHESCRGNLRRQASHRMVHLPGPCSREHRSNNLVARLTIALAAAGLRWWRPSLATLSNSSELDCLGDGHDGPSHLSWFRSSCVFIVGLCVLALAVGMPWWLRFMGQANQSVFWCKRDRVDARWLALVPLSGKFASLTD